MFLILQLLLKGRIMTNGGGHSKDSAQLPKQPKEPREKPSEALKGQDQGR
jgi:hypothetical protein